MCTIGIDVGSSTVKVVLLSDRNIVYSSYEKNMGEPARCLLHRLRRILERYPLISSTPVGTTGSGAEFISCRSQKSRLNEVMALFKAHAWGYDGARTVIEIGGQDSKLLFLSSDGKGLVYLSDFALNDLCSAGTGGFLEEQALRLGVEVSKIGEKAILSKNPAYIAGRCSVFAKSDMIHLQQVGVSTKDILFGLCLTLARNFKATLGKGKYFKFPIFFEGGVAANAGMVKAFKQILGIKNELFIVPSHHNIMGAIGAAVYAAENRPSRFLLSELILHLEYLLSKPNNIFSIEIPLNQFNKKYDGGNKPCPVGFSWAMNPTFLGIDVGSVSTNIALVSILGRPVFTLYKKTMGDPVSAVLSSLEELKCKHGTINISGVGVTGSGRHLIGELIGADIIKTEITAQARAAQQLAPDADTIFEIGGQDSKYIRSEKGRVVEFEMNRACAAGTGSFLEEISSKLGVDIERFSDMALDAKAPSSFGERCTVFMESDVVGYQQKGAKKEDLFAGLAYSIVDNYLNKVVGKRKLGKHIVFLGGVAKNAAVVSAFSNRIKEDICVPKFADVSGAIGAALLAKDRKPDKTRFLGFPKERQNLSIKNFRCNKCENLCLIQSVRTLDGSHVFLGSRCDRYTKKDANRQGTNFFYLRERLLKKWNAAGTFIHKIGFPRMGPYYDYWPFFSKMFEGLSVELIASNPTSLKTLEDTQSANIGEMCLPIKILAGHLKELEETNVDAILVPGIESHMANEGLAKEPCPYMQSLPFLARSFWSDLKKPLLACRVDFQGRSTALVDSFFTLRKRFGISRSLMQKAVDKGLACLKSFRQELIENGSISMQDRKHAGIVVIGRPYNTCDPFVSMRVADKITSLGLDAIPLDFLDIDTNGLNLEDGVNMQWYAGQRIIQAASLIKRMDNTYGLYYTNFGCGPDSFILHFFEQEMSKKPFLVLEVDEHSADTGIITRLEAFAEGLEGLCHK